ncbi:MAG: CPBP family intramembrane glutamic endopeptidase [Myxococcales bacterium]|nr:CPBP family intramembrane metalloprotease [Polyangiaceae bacterium]MDW8248312.1 CPBP family intramembrane glutamic endopeptidase [Myxococcales bacterium]
MALRKAISWSTFRALTQLAVLLLGLGAWRLLVPGGIRRLWGEVPSGRALVRTVLVSPLVWVSSALIALAVALPTLMEELRTRGPGASRQNAGAFAAELTGSSLPAALVTGVVLAAVSEELLFRGALWNALHGLLQRVPGPPVVHEELGPTAGQRLQGWLVGGWGATVGAGVIFGLMHGDMPGGVGIVRVVSTTCLGFAAGAARTLSGSVAAAVLLHLLYNTLSLGVGRGWFAGLGPSLYGVPAPLLVSALLGTLLLLLLLRRPSLVAPSFARSGEETWE